jgi:DNA invertase Pin-like site-specific DNA recombinase
MPFVAYYRVSTRKQGDSGLGLEAQREAVCRSIGEQPIAEFVEVESGKSNTRPKLLEALALSKLTGAVLVVAKLDRLSRNAAFLNTLFDSGQEVRFADMPFADRFTIGIMAQVAQWEAETISKRTKEALKAAKARGTKLGGDRGNIKAVSALGRAESARVRTERSQEWKALVDPYLALARANGCTTLQSIADYLNERQIKTARGGRWYAASVARIA